MLSHPELISAARSAIDYVRTNVRYRGLNTPGGWIRNPTEANQKVIARLYSLYVGSQRDAEYKGGFNGEYYVNELDKLAKLTNTGNCSELSAVAFNFLKDKGVRPIDYFGVFRGAWNHAFVIINRDAGTPLSNFRDWTNSAVLCDPLYDRFADAGFLASWYPRCLPFTNPDVKYRLE